MTLTLFIARLLLVPTLILVGVQAQAQEVELGRWCPFRKSYPDVVMTQSGQDRDGNNGAGSLNSSPQRRILAQGQVRTHLVIVRCI
jgi:hypothetical protein